MSTRPDIEEDIENEKAKVRELTSDMYNGGKTMSLKEMKNK